jgi:hypothetical protein
MKRAILACIALACSGCDEFMAGYNHAKYGTPMPQEVSTGDYYVPDADDQPTTIYVQPPPQPTSATVITGNLSNGNSISTIYYH